MKEGQYITDRWMEKILAAIANEQGIALQSHSGGWVNVLQKGERTGTFFGYKTSLNDSAAAGIANDKVATYDVLSAAGIPAVPHYLVRSKADSTYHWNHDIEGEFVAKPLNGTSGHGVKSCRSRREAEKYMRTSGIAAWAVSPFADIAREVRVVVLDGRVLVSYEKLPVEKESLRMFNLGLGAKAANISLSSENGELARRAMTATGLRLAAVDIVQVGEEWQVLEVNDGIMMENYMRQTAEHRSVGRGVYADIVAAMLA